MRSGTPPTIKHRICVFLCFALAVVGSVCARGQTVGVPSVDQLGNLEAKVRETFAVHAATTAADKLALTEKLVAAVDEDLRQRKVSDQTFATLTVALKTCQGNVECGRVSQTLDKGRSQLSSRRSIQLRPHQGVSQAVHTQKQF